MSVGAVCTRLLLVVRIMMVCMILQCVVKWEMLVGKNGNDCATVGHSKLDDAVVDVRLCPKEEHVLVIKTKNRRRLHTCRYSISAIFFVCTAIESIHLKGVYGFKDLVSPMLMKIFANYVLVNTKTTSKRNWLLESKRRIPYLKMIYKIKWIPWRKLPVRMRTLSKWWKCNNVAHPYSYSYSIEIHRPQKTVYLPITKCMLLHCI